MGIGFGAVISLDGLGTLCTDNPQPAGWGAVGVYMKATESMTI